MSSSRRTRKIPIEMLPKVNWRKVLDPNYMPKGEAKLPNSAPKWMRNLNEKRYVNNSNNENNNSTFVNAQGPNVSNYTGLNTNNDGGNNNNSVVSNFKPLSVGSKNSNKKRQTRKNRKRRNSRKH